VLIAPTVLALLALMGWPLVNNVLLSLRKVTLRELISRDVVWVGFDNYRVILAEPGFWDAVVRTMIFTVACTLSTMLLGVLMALLLVRLGRAVKIVFSVSLVLAWATPVLAATTVFQWLFDTDFGVVNWLLARLGMSTEGHSWFATGRSTFLVAGLLVVWQAVPLVVFSVSAALATVPPELDEAAVIDGASTWQRWWTITFPLVRPMVGILTFLQVIWDFKAFTQVYALRRGGPDSSTTTLPILIYQEGIARSQFGLAAAASVVTVLILLVVLALYVRSAVRTEEVR
jgi:N,N'-diacetylchitobiose transport system permease protein